MKVRNGFVSNSSSSSFLVGVPVECETFEQWLESEMYRMWHCSDGEHYIRCVNFPDEDNLFDKPIEDYEFTRRECLKNLWDDIHSLKKPHKVNLQDWIDWYTPMSGEGWWFTHPCGTFSDQYPFCDLGKLQNVYRESELAKEESTHLLNLGIEWNATMIRKLFNDFEQQYDGNIYHVYYSDNDGDYGCMMEHGDFWNLFDNIQRSEH